MPDTKFAIYESFNGDRVALFTFGSYEWTVKIAAVKS